MLAHVPAICYDFCTYGHDDVVLTVQPIHRSIFPFSIMAAQHFVFQCLKFIVIFSRSHVQSTYHRSGKYRAGASLAISSDS